MKTSKRLLSFFLAVVMVITTCSVGLTAFAADPPEDSVFTYINDEGEAVEITYESLEDLVNTYAPTIIEALRSTLEGIGVDVDAVIANEEPIHELVGQVSPVLLKLIGGSGDPEAIIGSYTAMDRLHYSYLDDDGAVMDFWSLYQFCKDNLKNSNATVKEFANTIYETLTPMFELYENTRSANQAAINESITVIQNIIGSAYTASMTAGGKERIIYNDYSSEAYKNAIEQFKTAGMNETAFVASRNFIDKVICDGDITLVTQDGNVNPSETNIRIGDIPNVIVYKDGLSEKTVDFTPFIEYVSSYARFGNFIGGDETLTLAQAIYYYFNFTITMLGSSSYANMYALFVSRGNPYTFKTSMNGVELTIQPNQSILDVCEGYYTVDYIMDSFASMFPNLEKCDELECLIWPMFGADFSNVTSVSGKNVTEQYYKDAVSTILVNTKYYDSYEAVDQAANEFSVTSEDLLAIRNRMNQITKSKEANKERDTKPTLAEFQNGVDYSGTTLDVGTILTDTVIDPIISFYVYFSKNNASWLNNSYINKNYTTFRDELLAWDGGELTPALQAFVDDVKPYFYSYQIWVNFYNSSTTDSGSGSSKWTFNLIYGEGDEYIDDFIYYNGALSKQLGNPYSWDQLAETNADIFNSDSFIEIVNQLINGYINDFLDPDTQIGEAVSGILDTLLETKIDLYSALKDIYKRIAEAPVETIFELMPILIVAVDELLIPLLFNGEGDAYYNDTQTIIDWALNLIPGFSDNLQSAGSPVGIKSLRWDLNKVLPTLLHWLNGDNDYTYTYYNVKETVDEETGEVVFVEYGETTTGANGTKYDNDGKATGNIPVILNIYLVDKALAGASIADLEGAEVKELVSNLALIAQDVIDTYVAEHGNDIKGETMYGGKLCTINKGINNIFVSLPSLISDIGQKFLDLYNVDSDWHFGTFDIDDEGIRYNVALQNFKQLAADSASAEDIMGTFVDIFINNWFNSITDLLNSVVADPDNDITGNLPIVASLLNSVDIFGENSVLTDIFNGFFLVTRDHPNSFTFEEQENGYVGLSTLNAYFLLSNIKPIIEFVTNIIEANKSADGDAGVDTTSGNSPVVTDDSQSGSSIQIGYDINQIITDLGELAKTENIKVAQELIDSVDSLLSTLLSNILVDGYSVDEVDGILSGVVTFLTNYFGTETANEILNLVIEYLRVINAASTTEDGSKNANSDGSVDADKVYSKENLSTLVTQTYALLEKIVDTALTDVIKGDDNKLINSAIKGVISPGAIAIRSKNADGELVIDQDIVSELTWADVAGTKYATDLGYDNLKNGDKEVFYEDLIASLGIIPAIAGTLLSSTGYYNNVLMEVLSPLCDKMGVKDYIDSIPADATGNEAVFAVLDTVSKLLNRFLDAPLSSIFGLVKGLAIVVSDNSFKTIIDNALEPVYNEIEGLSAIVGKLSPALAKTVLGFVDTIESKISEVIPEKDIILSIINKIAGTNLEASGIGSILPTLASFDNGTLLIALYTVALDVLTNNTTLQSILSLISGVDVGSLVEMLGKLDAVKVFYMLKEIINSTQDPTEIYWTFSKYAAKETNTFSYPKGITAEEADDAVDSLDELVKNLFPLLQSFDVVDQGSLPELVSGLLFTNENITKIATGVYGAIEEKANGNFSFSPKQFAAYLTDSSYGTTFSSAASTLSKTSSWKNVKNVNWGFTDGSAKAQQGFVNALVALCRPVNDVLAGFLAGGEVNFAELVAGVLKDLNISVNLADGVTLEIKNSKLTVIINSTAEGSKTNTIVVNLVPIINELSGLAITGRNGYESAIIPLLEAFMCDDIKTYDEYIKDYRNAKDNLLINILNPIMGFVNDVLEAPFDTLSAVLPNVAYFIDNNGIGQLLNNLLAPLTQIITVMDKNGLDVDQLISSIAGKSLAGIVEDLINDELGANISGLNLKLTDLNSCNIQEFVIPIVNALLKNNGINITLKDIDWGKLASLGTLNTVSSAAGGTTKQITANQGQVLVTVLRYIERALIDNAASISKLLLGIEKISSNKTIVNILDSVFAQIATANDDDIVLAVFYLLCGDPTNTFFDYRGFQYKDYEFSYPSTVDIEFLKNIAPMLDGLVGGLVTGGLNATVANLIYKDDIITSLATGLYGAVEKVKVGSMSLTTLLAKTGIDFTTTNVANLLVDKEYGKTYESVAKVIKNAGSWSKVDASKLSWGVTDRDSFVHALCAVLRPIYGVLDVLLNDGSLGLFNLIYLPGSDGYTSAIVPLMEAFGLYNIKTQYQYRQDMSKEYDAILLDILNPLLDKVEDILNAPIQTLADMLPNLALFFANDGLLQLIENLLTPINALLDAVSPVADVNDILNAVGLDIEKELSKLGLVGSGYKFDIYDLAGSLKPLIGSENIVSLLNTVLGLIKIDGKPLGIELMPIDWYQLASHGEVITNEASQTSTFGARVYVKSDPNEVLIAVLRYLIETINYKDNYSVISSLIGGLIGGADDSISGVIDQVLGMLAGDTDEVISELCGLLQTLA